MHLSKGLLNRRQKVRILLSGNFVHIVLTRRLRLPKFGGLFPAGLSHNIGPHCIVKRVKIWAVGMPLCRGPAGKDVQIWGVQTYCCKTVQIYLFNLVPGVTCTNTFCLMCNAICNMHTNIHRYR